MWGRFTYQGFVHIVPIKDTFSHDLIDICRCRPVFLYPDLIYSHNAFDKREYFENPPKKNVIVN